MNDAPGQPEMRPSPERRVRVTFATDDSVKYVGHLDMARAWERAIRRSGLPLAYSQGFHPQPRIQFAAALPLGFTGEAELVDIYLTAAVEVDEALARLGAALPAGVHVLHVEDVGRGAPALQTLVDRACYRVEVESPDPESVFEQRLQAFMARADAWRERRKGKEMARYDLRPLVLELAYRGRSGLGQTFDSLMRNAPGATGRPDELLAELGLAEAARRVIRVRLITSDDNQEQETRCD
jgi:radical SAM-linked protein